MSFLYTSFKIEYIAVHYAICNKDLRGYGGKCFGKILTEHTTQEYTEANARAKMLIHLNQNNLN